MSTELFVLDRGAAAPPAEAALLLPSWRRERLERLRNEGARRECLWAGLLFRHAMLAWGLDPDEPVALLPAGKPVFARRADRWFSLSHSGRYVACAVSAAPVGTDVQEKRPVNLSIARRFHPAERAWLDSLPPAERADGLYRIWTRKEAWVKAVSAERMLSLSEADVLGGLPGLCFRDFSLPGGCALALCAADPALPEGFTLRTPEQIMNEKV